MQTSVTEWLDETVKKFPQKLAVADETEGISFERLKRKSLAIARELIRQKIGEQEPIAVYMEKSFRVVVSFLGIAYSRNFYSPIDVEMPEIRIDKMLEVLRPKAVITTRGLQERFQHFSFQGAVLVYDEIAEDATDEAVVGPISRKIVDTDLLYVLFTSGSTGIPKGVGIRHRSVIDYIEWVAEEFGVCEKDTFGNQAPFYFDNSILDIYSMLKTGATLYIIPRVLFAQPVLLLQYLKEKHIDIIFWVPSALIMVAQLRALHSVDLSQVLRAVLFCGEVMPNKQLNYWRKNLPDLIYANLYGPTEITDACTFYRVDREFGDEESLPIGRPMKNTEILVLNEAGHLIPPENCRERGELCVRGTCLAVGYYNNPKKTAEGFVQNPLQNRYEDKVYRTGDLVQYNKYGELVYIGRKDDQIKHRGHRIELGEIETAVSSLEDYSRCCCLYDERRHTIVLFVETEEKVSKSVLHDQLKKLLPEYMLPEKVMAVSHMELNANGKIDRKKLRESLHEMGRTSG